MSRRPLVAGNWKLHLTIAEAKELVSGVGASAAADPGVEVAVAPVFTALSAVHEAIAGGPVRLAAQDCYWEPKGAFTGEVSATLLRDVGCDCVIVGHSERRQLFGETDEAVNRKARAVLDAGMAPIVCVGETLEQREANQTEAIVVAQVERALAGLAATQAAPVVVAYEPVWAIGTGRTAQPQDAQAVHARIRQVVAAALGESVASNMRLLYGGSVKPSNAAELMAQADIDGALVGGASLQADSFDAIIAAAAGRA